MRGEGEDHRRRVRGMERIKNRTNKKKSLFYHGKLFVETVVIKERRTGEKGKTTVTGGGEGRWEKNRKEGRGSEESPLLKH